MKLDSTLPTLCGVLIGVLAGASWKAALTVLGASLVASLLVAHRATP